MQRFCIFLRVRHLFMMVLRLNISLTLAEGLVSIQGMLLRPSTNFRPFQQCILHASCVIDSARGDPFPLPQTIMLKEICPRQLATEPYQIGPSWTPSSCAPEESDYSQRTMTRWTLSASQIQRKQWFSWTLGRDSLPPTPWKHRRLGVWTTATYSAADWNWPRHRCCAEQFHFWAMRSRCSGLPLCEPTQQSLLPICNMQRVHSYPVWDPEEGHEDILCECAEGSKHRSAFPKVQKREWHPDTGC